MFGLLIVALLLVPFGVLAQRASSDDPQDTSGLLDVRRVNLSGALERPTFKTITFKRWTAKRLWDRGYVIVHLDASGDNRFEHYILVRSTGGRMAASLYRDRKNDVDVFVGDVDVWRPNKRSVAVRVKLARLNMPEQRTYYRWFVKTLMLGNNCPTVCMDRVPNRGAERQSLIPDPEPTVEPTPLPTLTIVPSPEPTQTSEPTPEPTDAP